MSSPREPRERAALALAALAAVRPELLDDLGRCLADPALGYWAAQGIVALDAPPPRGLVESIAEWGMSTDSAVRRAALRCYLVLPGQARAWVIERGLDDGDPVTRELALRVLIALSARDPQVAAVFRRAANHHDASVRDAIAVEMGRIDPTASPSAAAAFTALVPEGLAPDAYAGTAQVVHARRELAAACSGGDVVVFELPSRRVILRRAMQAERLELVGDPPELVVHRADGVERVPLS